MTICLPLFLAGGEGDRAFARFHPTITVDGCELRCAARGTEMYSGKPAASLVVSELLTEAGLPAPSGRRRLDEAGLRAVDVTADRLTRLVDQVLDPRRGGRPRRRRSWARRSDSDGDVSPWPWDSGREGDRRRRRGDAMSRTAVYHTDVRWTGEHRGHVTMGNGPEMTFSAPPDSQGHAGVLTPEDAFVAAANTCVMLMFVWAAERFKLSLSPTSAASKARS